MTAALWASLAAASVEDGWSAWSAGDVDGAIAAWSAPDGSGVLAYDHGTALLTAGRPVEALAPLARASRLRPRDAAVFRNQALARGAAAALPDAPPLPPPAEVRPALARVVTPGELGSVSVVASVAASVVTALRARAGGVAVAAALAAAALLWAATAWTWTQLEGHPLAVVTATAPVRPVPDPLAKGERDLPPGAEVRVVREWGPFTLVEDGRGREGWVAEDALQRAW